MIMIDSDTYLSMHVIGIVILLDHLIKCFLTGHINLNFPWELFVRLCNWTAERRGQ